MNMISIRLPPLSPQVELFMKKEGELLKEVLSASTTEATTEVLTITSL